MASTLAAPPADLTNERVASARLLALGLQHVLVMYAGTVAVPLIVGGALHLPKEQLAFLINADLFAAGLATPGSARRARRCCRRRPRFCAPSNVLHSVINGRVVVDDGRLATLELDAHLTIHRRLALELAQAARAVPACA